MTASSLSTFQKVRRFSFVSIRFLLDNDDDDDDVLRISFDVTFFVDDEKFSRKSFTNCLEVHLLVDWCSRYPSVHAHHTI